MTTPKKTLKNKTLLACTLSAICFGGYGYANANGNPVTGAGSLVQPSSPTLPPVVNTQPTPTNPTQTTPTATATNPAPTGATSSGGGIASAITGTVAGAINNYAGTAISSLANRLGSSLGIGGLGSSSSDGGKKIAQTIDKGTDYLSAGKQVKVQQSKANAEAVVAGIDKANKEKQAIDNAKEQIAKIQEIKQDAEVGRGISQGNTCVALKQNREQGIKERATRATALAHLADTVAKGGVSPSFAVMDRQTRHRVLYCGQAEVKNGTCLNSPINQPLGDTNIANFVAPQSMTENEYSSAVDFVKNIVDPIVTIPESQKCTTKICEVTKRREAEYMSYASVIQSAFFNAIANRMVLDSEIRTLVNKKLQQDPSKLSGDNWQVDQGTAYPDGSEVAGGKAGGSSATPAPSTNTEPSKDSLIATTEIHFIGDDIAKSYLEHANKAVSEKAQSDIKAGIKPRAVLDKVKKLKLDKEKPLTVVLSTGYINMTDNNDRQAIREQLEWFKGQKNNGYKITVIVLGLPKAKTHENDWLGQQAGENGLNFNGSFTSDNGKTPKGKEVLNLNL